LTKSMDDCLICGKPTRSHSFFWAVLCHECHSSHPRIPELLDKVKKGSTDRAQIIKVKKTLVTIQTEVEDDEKAVEMLEDVIEDVDLGDDHEL